MLCEVLFFILCMYYCPPCADKGDDDATYNTCTVASGAAGIRGTAADDARGRGGRRQPDLYRLQEPVRSNQREERRHAATVPGGHEQGVRSHRWWR